MYEWEEARRQAALEEYGIDLADATEVFEQRYLDLPAYNSEEQRRIAIGEASGRIIAVVYIWRDDLIQLLSALPASRNEREAYYKSIRRGGA